jgi:hypothetical protein
MIRVQKEGKMPFVEPLEQRRLFSAAPFASADPAPADPPPPAAGTGDVPGPRLTGFRVLGSPLGVTGIRVTFDAPLDPARARREDNYVLRGAFTSRDLGEERVPDADGDFSESAGYGRRTDEIGLAGVSYDDATRTVTLLRNHGFLLSHLHTLHVRSGPDGLRDPAGNFLDGDYDGLAGGIAVLRMRTTWGKRVNYFDADGDRVRLRLRGPGRLFVFRQIARGGEGRRAGNAVQVWLAERSTPQTVLSGTVTPSQRGGDGRTTIGEILSAEEARIDLLGDPGFQVGTVVP